MKKAFLNRFSYLYKPAMRSLTVNHEDVAITVSTIDPSRFITRGKVTVGMINNGDCVLIRMETVGLTKKFNIKIFYSSG